MGDTTWTRQELLERAADPATTPFDYLIVGSGAGGGPLAARLAAAGKTVLVLEAGGDPAAPDAGRGDPPYDPALPAESLREISQVPGYHGASTEDPEMSWQFSVRHFTDDALQQQDRKYSAQRDPSAGGGGAKGGIQYPRSSGIGGCTGHHAMIIIAPNDRDWDTIAGITGDDSWRSENMRQYFTRIERCLYESLYQGFLRKLLGWVWIAGLKVVAFVYPRAVADAGGHGTSGWQPTSFVDPNLNIRIAENDNTFKRVLVAAITGALAKKGEVSILEKFITKLRPVQFVDPNDRNTRLERPAGVCFIPIGTDGVRRVGVRELLLKTAAEHPDRLVLRTGVHATRIIFAPAGDQEAAEAAPRAIGVEAAVGRHLYEASPLASKDPPGPARVQFFARCEVIVCGGSFNTPQLLMLSGIGDPDHLRSVQVAGPRDRSGKVIADVIGLPGVGQNLRDRYEITVVSELEKDFSTLQGVSFIPEDPRDPARKAWLSADPKVRSQSLYTTNGGALAIMHRSGEDPGPESDLFIFGAPAAFRGYYWGWSKELLHRTMGAKLEQRNLWSWVILKAYTNNQNGRVSLRSDSPFLQPEINFDYFAGRTAEEAAGTERDVDALVGAVGLVRGINQDPEFPLKDEIQPGKGLATESPDLRKWIKTQAWGHHACGTCRMGSDQWQASTGNLRDKMAVLDSKFRVHGVRGLRVVDASAFPVIPGYFLVTSVFMISEKAADTILPDSPSYPEKLEEAEAAAVALRRERAFVAAPVLSEAPFSPPGGLPASDDAHPPGDGATHRRLPPDTVGLALSGGGIRSATFCLGVIQGMAKRNRLRRVDLLSTVSGGGFTGGFLGRIYTQLQGVADNPGRVQELLANPTSPEVCWLRENADYIAANGRPDVLRDLGIIWRNLFTVHLVIGTLGIAGLGFLRWIEGSLQTQRWAGFMFHFGPVLSPWWWVPLAVLALGVIPTSLGFWLAPESGVRAPHPFYPLLAWIVILGGAVFSIMVPATLVWALAVAIVLFVAYFWQEAVRWKVPTGTNARQESEIVRNRLTGALGETLLVFVSVLLWVGLDSLARLVAAKGLSRAIAEIALVVGPLLPFVGRVTQAIAAGNKAGSSPSLFKISMDWIAALVSFPLLALLVVALDILVLKTFAGGLGAGILLTLVALAFSIVVARASRFLNRSSLNSVYTARLTRTFLGASNPARIFSSDSDPVDDVQVSHPKDDLPFGDYHPEQVGGPLHFINVCIDQTVEGPTERQLRKDKGLPMCLGPSGVSVGRRFHSLWVRDTPGRGAEDGSVLQPIPTASNPTAFHVLARAGYHPVTVQSLPLGQWMAISGAAFTTGLGRKTSLPVSLLLGLVNLRIGFWWDSRIAAAARPGRYDKNLWQRLKAIPGKVFQTQFRLLDEWRAYFPGPSRRLWYLSDGGHFENSGMYELIRRRVPFIISVDGGADPDYHFEDLAILTRQVRLDFHAEFAWLERAPAPADQAGWAPFFGAGQPEIPGWIRNWINPEAIGSRGGIERTGSYGASLARITYSDAPKRDSWVLLLKSSLGRRLPVDVQEYADEHDDFPNEPTYNQFFNDAQWESYRVLGEGLGAQVFRTLPP